MARGRWDRWLALGTLLFVTGCVPARGGWDLADLPPEVRSGGLQKEGRLSDLLPQPLPAGPDLVLFLCRWPTDYPIAVSFPADASARERKLLGAALRAWEAAGLGVSFREVEASEARLAIEFPTVAEGRPKGTGDALADCRIRLHAQESFKVEAHLVWASIHLVRELRNWKGQRVALSDDELLGAMLHELGHALGFSGHVASGDSIMLGETAVVRRIARNVERGQPLPAPELVALYGLPSGIQVGHLALDPSQQRELQAFNREAQAQGLDGPFSRVGDVRARLFYRDQRGAARGVTFENWSQVLREGGELRWVWDRGVRVLPKP